MIVSIDQIKPNPKNPRVIKDDKFLKLKKSIEDFPDMLNKRPLIAFTDKDNKYVVLGGNMRLKASKELGLKELPIILADDWTEEQKAEFLIKDNVGFGDWDWSVLTTEWNVENLSEWGLDVPNFVDDLSNNSLYKSLDQLSKLDKFLTSELKRMYLVYDNETFKNVICWFNKQQNNYNLENHSQVILRLMQNENI
jgi:uncharacterized phage-like protein YoqJ